MLIYLFRLFCYAGDGIDKNGCNDEQVGSTTGSDTKQNCHVPTRKLGFGLVGSGKRAAMPSVFHEADDEDVEERKMRPLVPIDYSTDEIQAIQSATSAAQPNLVAAAEFAKRISSVNHKEERLDVDKERNKRTSDRASQRERDRSDDGNSRLRDENKERIHKVHDRERDQEDKLKENRKLLDAKQLIDMIPKTKDELFAYQINWDVYDKVNSSAAIKKKKNQFSIHFINIYDRWAHTSDWLYLNFFHTEPKCLFFQNYY